MEHNPRVIELVALPRAIRGVEDLDDKQALEAERLLVRTRRAIKVDAVEPESSARLEREAGPLGIVVFRGSPGPRGTAPHVLVADEESLRRLSGILEGTGEKELGSSIRATLGAYHRSAFVITFTDGQRLELGERTRVMGVINVTPDSFSDAGRFPDPEAALAAAARMAEAGADLIDVGGESTRPGSDPIPEAEEIRRVLPVIETIKRELAVRVSVDTTKASVARRAHDAGADLVNDISAFRDPGMVAFLRDTRMPAVIMHMRGTPKTMQQDTHYVDLMSSILGLLRRAVEKAVNAGISDDKIVVDPGLGFGKSAAGSLQILRELPTLRSMGRPILIGASRKSFIGATLNLPVGERLEGSLAVAALAAWQGAHIIRAHDVAQTVRVVRMIDAIRSV